MGTWKDPGKVCYIISLLTSNTVTAMATKDCIISKVKKPRHIPYPKQKPDGTQIRESQSFSKQQCSASDTFENSTRDKSSSPNAPSSKTYPCVSARQPYAGFILNGRKTIETRWNPMFRGLEGKTVAIHIARKDWEGGGDWRELLNLTHKEDQIKRLLEDGERHGRGVIAGLVDIGETWQCPTDPDSEQASKWEKSALLRPVNEKYLTKLANPQWLKRPVEVRGQRGVWEVKILADCL